MNNLTLLVTGGCGFIGSNFIRHLLEETDFAGTIVNIDKLTYAGNPHNLNDIARAHGDRYIFIKEDICNFERIERVFSEYAINGVCHFAAESHVDRSIKHPIDFINTNIIGTFNLLECARSRLDSFRIFHHISTDEVYGSLGPEGLFTEETPYQPNSPYSASKASSDHLVRAYHETYGLPTTLSNCSNNYGPYQFPEKLIPLMILNGVEGKPLPVYGDGKNVRDWLYVKDHCTAIWTIMTEGRRGHTYNVGGNCEMENITIVEMICDILDDILSTKGDGPRRRLITFVQDRPGHDRRYAIDFEKLRREMSWEPKESFASGLEKTIRWYLDNNEWIDKIRTKEYRAWISAHYGT